MDAGLVDYARDELGLRLEIVRRCDDVRGFQVLPRRCVVERTFGWLTRSRRLARDYERKTEHAEAMIKVAMIRLMTARLTGHHIDLHRPIETEAARRLAEDLGDGKQPISYPTPSQPPGRTGRTVRAARPSPKVATGC